MPADINAIISRVWRQTGEKNPAKAVLRVIELIPQSERPEVFRELLKQAYSQFVAAETRPAPKVRRNPASSPRLSRDLILSDLDERPFYIPSLGKGSRVKFRDMTAAYWSEWIEWHRKQAGLHQASASWGALNVLRLAENNVSRSGLLPGEVKQALFSDKGASAADLASVAASEAAEPHSCVESAFQQASLGADGEEAALGSS